MVWYEGCEGVKWELGFALFWAGKWDLLHWNWDSTTENGINNFENGKGIFILALSDPIF